MNSPVKYSSWMGLFLSSAFALACSSMEQSAPKPAIAASPAVAMKTDSLTAKKTKAIEVQGVISAVGQRTITFQTERKGKVREEVVGVDDKTQIEKGGANVKLGDLQESDLALINYEPEAYTPAIAIKVTGKGKLKKLGGAD